MADDPELPSQEDDFRKRLEEPGAPVGANADGQVEVFPLSELPARLAEMNRQEEAWDQATREPEQVEAEEDVGDLSDLDDLDEALGGDE